MMLAVAVIVFREVVEAALVVGVVLAASRGVPRRTAWICGGIAMGVLGATLVAAFTGEIANALDGIGEEIFDATILFAAVVMLGIHNIWMGRHGRELADEASSTAKAVRAGSRPLAALGIVVAVAVLREGSEIVLFVYGLAAAQGTGLAAVALGGLLGIAGGVATGAAIYLGLISVPVRHLFTVTSAVILLLAAGMAAQGAAFLMQADLVPPLGEQLWDTSRVVTEQSLLGQLLHGLVGYVARPAGVQVLAYG
ncbi:MAG TPA: FTR1 family protein, partial [Stellaceae bacterium]|nr:FTR1 family protein [Stellaceae bacterium]